MNTIILTSDELEAITNTSSANQVYYAWVGILALHGRPLPLFYHELPEHIEDSIFKLDSTICIH